MFNVKLDNGKQVTVQLDKSDDSYTVQGGGAGYSTKEEIKRCKALNKDSPEPRKWVKTE
jgi:hypothetical protein